MQHQTDNVSSVDFLPTRKAHMKIPIDLGTVEVRRNQNNTAIIFEAIHGSRHVIVSLNPEKAAKLRAALTRELMDVAGGIEMLAKGLI